MPDSRADQPNESADQNGLEGASSGVTPEDLRLPAHKMCEKGVFPKDWALIPVAGKGTRLADWGIKRLTHEEALNKFKTNFAYKGLGVVTGALSGGLIALDIDGFEANMRFRDVAADEYEEFGQEKTISWTSGKPGRRQILWRVPPSLIPQLSHVTTLICLESGEWVAPTREKDGKESPIKNAPSEELVLRFNRCQSVLPGSPHPDTKRRFKFLQYHDGVVQDAPEFVLNALRQFAKPADWLAADDLRAIESEVTPTLVPPKQIRGWFFKEEVQNLLMPRVEDLIFKHPVFDYYGWEDRGGVKPQRMSGCPWHGGNSGTSFQYNPENGLWDCKACKVGGDVLDFIHKIESDDMYAGRPIGAEVELYVKPIAEALGFSYPECCKEAQKFIEIPRLELTEEQFLEKLNEIDQSVDNPAVASGEMARIAMLSGRRLTGTQCQEALAEYLYFKQAQKENSNENWYEVEAMTYLIPNLLMRPSQVLLHAGSGHGKTSACMGLARIVGNGLATQVRGIEVDVEPGPVLWIQNDQTKAKLRRDCEDNYINPEKDKWFIVKRGFQINHKRQFIDWIKKYQPKLVVVDSIGSCSTRMQVQEKDKAFASPLYTFGELNGSPDGFPATTIIWIHHDNASGEARGTRYLPAAVDEEWHLRPLSDEERRTEREAGRNPSNCRFVQIKKSRLGRGGDRLLVERDVDFSYAVRDVTPTERRSDFGQGDPEPHTMALRIIRDAKREAGEEPFKGLTAAEVCDVLGDELMGQSRKAVSVRTTKRWLDRWVEDGILVHGQPALSGAKNRKTSRYTTPHTRSREEPEVLRAMSVFTGVLTADGEKPSQGLDLSMDKLPSTDKAPEGGFHVEGGAHSGCAEQSQSGLSPSESPESVSIEPVDETQSLEGESADLRTNHLETDIGAPTEPLVSHESQNLSKGTSPEDFDDAFGV